MWYKLDVARLALQLLPPVLRRGLLVPLLMALLAPFRQAYARFMEIKGGADGKLAANPAVQYVEKALNDAFHLKERQIRVETAEAAGPGFWRLKAEGQPAPFMHGKGGPPMALRRKGEPSYGFNFTVRVPTFLCTSADPGQDKHAGRHLRTIRALLDYYKPAGRTYRIETYDYE